MWWDNRQGMHRMSAYTESIGSRDVRRTMVVDHDPWVFGVEKEEGDVIAR